MILRRSLLLLLCLLLSCGAAATLIVDSLDGDEIGPPAGVLPVLVLRVRCALPPPMETARIQPGERDTRAPRPPRFAPASLRAPPAR